MCGICGEVDLLGAPDAEPVRRMARAIAHRGPDAEGFFTEGPAALGHRRLSILDLEGGVQPMVREGVALVFNGQAYEHAELRERLRARGHAFTTRSDTEVVLRAYLEWGERFVEELHGMFAVALWDAPRRKLVLARDRLGKKPLYYALAQGSSWTSAASACGGTGSCLRRRLPASPRPRPARSWSASSTARWRGGWSRTSPSASFSPAASTRPPSRRWRPGTRTPCRPSRSGSPRRASTRRRSRSWPRSGWGPGTRCSASAARTAWTSCPTRSPRSTSRSPTPASCPRSCSPGSPGA